MSISVGKLLEFLEKEEDNNEIAYDFDYDLGPSARYIKSNNGDKVYFGFGRSFEIRRDNFIASLRLFTDNTEVYLLHGHDATIIKGITHRDNLIVLLTDEKL